MESPIALSLYESGSDHVQEPEKFKPLLAPIKRSKTQEMVFLKMFKIRETLKWKYNYFEMNPQEHRSYRQSLKNFGVHRKSFMFKKMWRIKMDKLYYEESLKAKKLLLTQELKKRETVTDPTRLLVNYDREVSSMIRRVKDVFNTHLRFPKLYPNYREEKQRFLSLKCFSVDTFINIKGDIDKEFQFYWKSRITNLRDMKIANEKRLIQENWKKLMPVYFNSGEETSFPEELQTLLSDISDDEMEIDYNI